MLFEIPKVGVQLKRNLVGGFEHLERKTKQTNNPFVSGNRKFTLPGSDPIFWKLKNRAPFLIHVELDTQRLVAVSPETVCVPAGRTALPPGHPPGGEESSSHLTSPAHPHLRMTFLETSPLTFPPRRLICTERREKAHAP